MYFEIVRYTQKKHINRSTNHFACYAKDTLQSHSQMTHLDSSSLSPTTSAGTRNRPLLPHFEHLLASLQVRKLIFILISILIFSHSGWI